MSYVDLAIVGAGAAGLAATKTARELGLAVVTFEAMDRIGGRAHSDSQRLGFPWDAGCHWLHSASINPFTRYADANGFWYQSEPTPWHVWLGGRASTSSEDAEMDAFIEASYAAAKRCGDEGIDIPVANIVDIDNPWLDVLRLSIAAEWGVDLPAASTLDVARYRDTDENWPVVDGYGALVAQVANGQPVELKTPVHTIAWSSRGVRVTTTQGTLDAKAALVTVSTSVLADGGIAFDPPLPLWKQEAFSAVPLGRADKVALLLDERALADVSEHNLGVAIAHGQYLSLRFCPYGRPIVDAYLAGPVSADLAAQGEAAMVAATTDAMVQVLGTTAANHVVDAVATNWAAEPFIRGAYAAALPGHAERRADLTRPVGDRLFWAGEATSPEFFSTCHGAWESGVAAARAVAAMLGRGLPHE